MRCYICDYTRNGLSLFGEGVFLHSEPRRFRQDLEVGGMICSECDAEVDDALSEFEEDSEEEDYAS